MGTRKAHIGKMQSQLKHWNKKIDRLVDSADREGDEAKAEYRTRVSELQMKHRTVQAKLDELKSGSSEGWEVFKIGVEDAWRDFEMAFKNLLD